MGIALDSGRIAGINSLPGLLDPDPGGKMIKILIAILGIALLLGLVFVYTSSKNSVQTKSSITNPSPSESNAPSENKSVSSTLVDVVGTSFKLNENFTLKILVSGLGDARDLVFSPNGTLLVSSPASGKIWAVEEGKKTEVIAGLDRPHGLAFHNGKLFIAEETRVSRYNYDESAKIASFEKNLFDLPGGGGGHFTRSIVFGKNGEMFVSLGSTCNVCLEKDKRLAAILVSDEEGNNPRIFAKGLRNAVFLTTHPQTGQLYSTEMGRDGLGDDIPPDEINLIEEGNNYGWPICYGDKIHDSEFDKKTYVKNPCEETVAPVYKICAHCAPLGLKFIFNENLPFDWQGDLFVALHGSWNRSEPSGYKIIKINFEEGAAKKEEDFLTGFMEERNVTGRPVDIEIGKDAKIYISDDRAGVVYQIEKNSLIDF